MSATLEFEENHRAICGDENIAARVMQGINLHVRRAGRIADVDRVVEDSRIAIEAGQLLLQPRKAAKMQAAPPLQVVI